MQTKRCKQVGELLKTEVSRIIRTRLNDPRVGFVTITDVVVSKDLRYARIFVSVLDESRAQESVAALQGAHAFIQNELTGSVRLRFLPVLQFSPDTSWEKHARIDRLLFEIERDGVEQKKR
ncbi:MAG TPA: 30S ribosome-binding factor RbfA [bacterium]|nr:30S ribosome-binding factor RbfA [bacterium]